MADQPTPRWSRAAVVLLVVLATVPLLASALRVGPDWAPQGDDATIVLRGDDALTRHSPLVGMPSTVSDAADAQVFHPGPMESQAIGVSAVVVDDGRNAVLVVTLVNLAAVLVALAWSFRLGRAPLLAVAAVVVATLLWSLRGPILVTPFNPYVAILPLLAYLVSLAAAWDRQRWAVTSAVVFGSWASQAHLTTAGPVGAAAAAALAVGVWRWGRERGPDRPPRADRRQVLVGLGVLAVCWAAPLLDVVVHEGGNPRALLEASGSLEDQTLGARRALDVTVQALTVRPVWAQAGALPLDLLGRPTTGEYAVVIALGLAAAVTAFRCRRSRPAVTGAVVVSTAALVAGAALTAKIPSAFYNAFALHNYLWFWSVSAVLWVAVGAGIVHLVAERTSVRVPVRVPMRAVLAGALAAVTVVAVAGSAPSHRGPSTAASTYVRAIEPEALDALDEDDAYLIDLSPNIAVYGIGTGLLFALERAGFDVRVPEAFEASFGAHRVDDGSGRQRLEVQMGRDEPAAPSPDARLIASYTPPAALLEQREDLEDELIERIERDGGTVVAGGEEITPDEVEDWVRGGGFAAAQSFRLLDPVLDALPVTKALTAMAGEPLQYVSVYLVPAP